MIIFPKKKVLLLHKFIAEETGGSIGIRDGALFDAALEAAFTGFGDKTRGSIPPKKTREQALDYIDLH